MKILTIKYGDEILVEQSLDERKISIYISDDALDRYTELNHGGLIDLSRYVPPYHIVQGDTSGDVFICLSSHDEYEKYGEDFKIMWESDEALQSRVMFKILGKK